MRGPSLLGQLPLALLLAEALLQRVTRQAGQVQLALQQLELVQVVPALAHARDLV